MRWSMLPPQLRQNLRAAGVAPGEHFAVGVTHFAGWGARVSVPRANPAETLEALEQRELTPEE